jgi:hypothetical protein
MALVDFELVGEISRIETIPVGRDVRDRRRLARLYGKGRWRKMKGVGRIRLPDGWVVLAELHWHEAHGIGRKELKAKRYLE